jgi:hypothetical protein
MVPHHHAGQFLPKTKVFSRDFTLIVIALVAGESVIGHGTWRERYTNQNGATC